MTEAPLIELTIGDEEGSQTACLTIPEAIKVATHLLREAGEALDAIENLEDENG